MPLELVPSVQTPVSLPQLAKALSGGFPKIMGTGARFPSARAMAGAFAQLCFECGNGQKARDFNFHNEKLSSTWDGKYQQYRCTEIFDARMTALAHRKGPCSDKQWKDGPLRLVTLEPPHPWSSFLAFDSAEAGAARYLKLIACGDRYTRAWHALYHGDWAGFAHELRVAGYYTADEEEYTRGLVSIASRSLSLCDATLAEEELVLSDDDVAQIIGLGQIVIAETIWMHDRHHIELAA